MRASIDLINLFPSVPLKGDVLERLWTGKDVSYDNLRVLVVKNLFISPKMSGQNLMSRPNHVFS